MAGCSTGAYGMALDGSASGRARRKDRRVLTAPDTASSQALLTQSASVSVMSRVGSDGSAWRRVRRALAVRATHGRELKLLLAIPKPARMPGQPRFMVPTTRPWSGSLRC